MRISSTCFQASWSRAPILRIRFFAITGGPRLASMFSKCGMPKFITVRAQVPNSQCGWVTVSQNTRGVIASGT